MERKGKWASTTLTFRLLFRFVAFQAAGHTIQTYQGYDTLFIIGWSRFLFINKCRTTFGTQVRKTGNLQVETTFRAVQDLVEFQRDKSSAQRGEWKTRTQWFAVATESFSQHMLTKLHYLPFVSFQCSVRKDCRDGMVSVRESGLGLGFFRSWILGNL